MLSLLFVVSGCDVDVEGDEPGECSDGTDNDQDGAADCEDSGCAVDVACTGADDDGPCDDVEPGPGSLEGTVVRSAQATEDGVGTLVVSVYDTDPLQNEDACELASSSASNVDLSGEANGFGYTVGGIPTRAEPYIVVALFDDNGDLDALGQPGPGDLLSYAGETTAFPTAVVADAAPVPLQLELNFVFGGDDGGDDDDSSGPGN